MIIPTIVKPKLISLKNRWKSGLDIKRAFGRDIVIAFFSLAIMFAMYYGLCLTLSQLTSHNEIAEIHPTVMLGLLLLSIFFLLLFSNSVTALGSLFLSQDLDLILSAPISRWKLFYGKLVEIFGSSTWMVITFGLPVIVAFGEAYHGSISFYAHTVVAVIPLLIIPSAVSIIAVTIFATFVPANRTREIFLLVGSLAIFLFLFVYKKLVPSADTNIDNLEDVLQVLSLFKVTSRDWSPAYWASVYLGERLTPTGKNVFPHLAALYSATLMVVSGAFVVFSLFHARAYSIARSSSSTFKIRTAKPISSNSFIGQLFPRQQRALFSKDVRLFLRDMTQALQLILLLGLCVLYIYNFRILRVIEHFPAGVKLWWEGVLLLGNLAMGSFIIAAVATRFVFASISYEGKAFWIIQSAPLGINKFLKAKFWTWYPMVSLISCILLTSGAFALNANPHSVAVTTVVSGIICYGTVGLGVGLGAVYANFDWEHSSQLAASFGGLVYMISSAILIGVSLVPSGLIIFLRSLRELGLTLTTFQWYLLVSSASALLVFINYSVSNWALRMGEETLRKKQQ